MLLIAKFVLILLIPLAGILASVYRPAVAGIVILLAAILFGPSHVAFDFPLIPPMGRQEIASVAMFGFVLLYYPHRFLSIRPGWGVDSLIFVLILGTIGTVYTNTDELEYGPRIVQGMRPYDIFSETVRDVIRYTIPFLLGRALFRSSRELRTLLTLFVASALLYSLFILVELRVSPQFHRWVYGFHPQSWAQHVRWGGYRPMVFLGTGLAISIYIASAAVVAVSLTRARVLVWRIEPRVAAGYLAGILVACKSYASIAYGMLGMPAVFFLRPQAQTRLAALLAVGSLLYPIARTYDVFPRDDVLALASQISAERAASLEYRFRNEDVLLIKAQERVLFGWGGYNRNRVFDERHGGSITITDGYWIIQLGQRGILGLLASFGFIVLPVLVANRRLRRVPGERDQILVAGLALVVALMTADLLPNGLFNYLPLVMAGALLGVTEGLTSPAALRRARAARIKPQKPALPATEPNLLDDERIPAGAPALHVDEARPSSLAHARQLRGPHKERG